MQFRVSCPHIEVANDDTTVAITAPIWEMAQELGRCFPQQEIGAIMFLRRHFFNDLNMEEAKIVIEAAMERSGS